MPSCHEPTQPIYTRITNVENNSFLLAPLARSAGGTERCGKPIFASKDDPDYQAILKTFESLDPLFKSSPRADMVDIKAPVCDRDPSRNENEVKVAVLFTSNSTSQLACG